MSARASRLNTAANLAIGGGLSLAALSGALYWLLSRIDRGVTW